MTPQHTLARRQVSALIYEDVRNSIVRLELAPGSFVYEGALAEKYGASRTPVRQALAQLERDQLLEVLPQRGARVAPLSIRVINEAQQVRESLEVTAIGTLATNWDGDALSFRLLEGDIEVNLEQQDQASSARDYMSFVSLDSSFHSLLMSAAGNDTLQRCVESVRLHLQRMRYLELEFMHHEVRSIEQHRGIVDAVRDNDVPGATEQMADHLALLAGVRDHIIARRAELFQE